MIGNSSPSLEKHNDIVVFANLDDSRTVIFAMLKVDETIMDVITSLVITVMEP